MFSNTTSQSKTSSQGGATSQSGYAFVTSGELNPYRSGPVNATKIFEIYDNMYVAGPTSQLTNMVMSGDAKITVYDDRDDVVEDVSRSLNKMFSQPNCSISSCARSAIHDIIVWGVSIYNWVWQYNNGHLECTELSHLHPFTFRTAPHGNNATKSFGRLLYGIYYDYLDKQIHYCQTNKTVGTTTELERENLFVVSEPSSQYPDGDSKIYPLAPIIDFLNYAWNTLSQQMFRTGAPIMFIKIDNPQPARTVAGVRVQSDEEYAREILANWGKDTQFPLRPNMEIMQIDVKEGSLAIQSINKAGESIRDYLSPVGMLGRDGTLIAGSQSASLRLVNNYIKGWASLLETNLRELPNYYLRHNGYPDTWHAEVTIPHNTFDDVNINLQKAQVLISSKVGSPNEVRELLGYEGVSDDELVGMNESWKQIAPEPSMGMMGAPMAFAHAEPGGKSKTKRNELSNNCLGDIEDATDDLERMILSAIRNEMKS